MHLTQTFNFCSKNIAIASDSLKESIKYIQVYIIRKTIWSAFHCFYFMKTFHFISFIFGHFLPFLVQIFNQIQLFKQKLYLLVLIVWKIHEPTKCSHIRLKNVQNSKQWPKFMKIWVTAANLGKLIGLNILNV